ncbi:hypothetical protein B0T11DRAFT_279724 [Plectosphaerella cucumerina]|uniref:Uncharacterized protein n=1 Tax=Plectosphaerella cucumerina TaxID=40658 RepID=A0A8K0TK41_9PEZI|nr:hypothetical protein B0T11DRAFT_279724 [Plectosphaerella cucumerina]
MCPPHCRTSCNSTGCSTKSQAPAFLQPRAPVTTPLQVTQSRYAALWPAASNTCTFCCVVSPKKPNCPAHATPCCVETIVSYPMLIKTTTMIACYILKRWTSTSMSTLTAVGFSAAINSPTTAAPCRRPSVSRNGGRCSRPDSTNAKHQHVTSKPYTRIPQPHTHSLSTPSSRMQRPNPATSWQPITPSSRATGFQPRSSRDTNSDITKIPCTQRRRSSPAERPSSTSTLHVAVWIRAFAHVNTGSTLCMILNGTCSWVRLRGEICRESMGLSERSSVFHDPPCVLDVCAPRFAPEYQRMKPLRQAPHHQDLH